MGSAVSRQRRWQGARGHASGQAHGRCFAAVFFYAFGYGDPTPSGGDAAG